ncbi:hypothetical protein JXA80_01410 [bacterium]|nr:hypothetical protein [candidate division CSSED10-310 bacterium]
MGILHFTGIVLLPGMLTCLVMMRGRSSEWLHEWGRLWVFIPLPAGFMVVSSIMEVLEAVRMVSFPHVVALSLLYSVVITGFLASSDGFNRSVAVLRTAADRRLIIPAMLLGISLLLTIHPTHFIFETTDSGVYVSSGINTFRTGSFRFVDAELRDADPAFQQCFYQLTPPEHYDSARHFHFEAVMGTGFFVRSLESGLIEPRYFNLHPLWIGLFVSMFGLEPGVWLATPFAAFCGISGIYVLAIVLAGRRAALVSVGLLAIFVIQVWIGRYITTEMTMQATIMNGLAWWLLFTDSTRRFGAGCAGLMLGLSHFARIDSVLILAAIILTVCVQACFCSLRQHMAGTHATTRFPLIPMIVYLPVAATAVVMAATRFHVYTMETLRHTSAESLTTIHFAIIAAGSAIAAVALCRIVRKNRLPLLAFLEKNQPLIWQIILIVAAAVLFMGYVVRPMITPPDYEAFLAASQTDRSYALSEMTQRWLAWYLSLPGYIAAWSGLFILLRRSWSLHTIPVWMIFLAYLVYYGESIHCTPYHYWGMRRFAPVVFPALMIGIGVCFDRVVHWSASKRSHGLAGIATLALAGLTAFLAKDTAIIYRFNHWEGAIPTLQTISRAIPADNSRLLLPQYPGIYLHMPLRLIFERNTYLLQPNAQPPRILAAITEWIENGDAVFLMTTEAVPHGLYAGCTLELVAHDQPVFPILRDTIRDKPKNTAVHGFQYWIYRIHQVQHTP